MTSGHPPQGAVDCSPRPGNDSEAAPVARDVLREAREKAEEVERIKSAFLAMVSHEMHTPLHQISGFSSLIASSASEPEIREYAELIGKSAGDFLEILGDLFDLAVAEHAVLKLSPEEFTAREIFTQNRHNLERILRVSGRSDLKLIFEVDSGAMKTRWRGDRLKINRVLDNLFKNAVKFSDPGEVVFGFRPIDPDVLGFWVRDNGPGVPPEKQDILFDLFRRADESPTRRHGGMGIGLAICKKFSDALGGTIHYEPGPVRGSIFRLDVPLEKIPV